MEGNTFYLYPVPFAKEIINYLFVHVFQTQEEYVLSTDQILPVVNT